MHDTPSKWITHGQSSSPEHALLTGRCSFTVPATGKGRERPRGVGGWWWEGGVEVEVEGEGEEEEEGSRGGGRERERETETEREMDDETYQVCMRKSLEREVRHAAASVPSADTKSGISCWKSLA